MECPACGNLCDLIAYDQTITNGNKTVKTGQIIESACCHAQISWMDNVDIVNICNEMLTNKITKNAVIQQIVKFGYSETDAKIIANYAEAQLPHKLENPTME